jgi:hypothetical protein
VPPLVLTVLLGLWPWPSLALLFALDEGGLLPGIAAFCGVLLHGPLLGGGPDGAVAPFVLLIEEAGRAAELVPGRNVFDTVLSAVSVAQANPGKESSVSGDTPALGFAGLAGGALGTTGAEGISGTLLEASGEATRLVPAPFAVAVAVPVPGSEAGGATLEGALSPDAAAMGCPAVGKELASGRAGVGGSMVFREASTAADVGGELFCFGAVAFGPVGAGLAPLFATVKATTGPGLVGPAAIV